MGKILRMLVMQDQPNISLFFNVETARFRKKFPDMEIDIDFVPWHLGAGRIIRHIKDYNGPDIVQVGNSWLGSLNRFNCFMDLKGHFSEIDNKSFHPAAVDMSKIPGSEKMPAVPWYLDIRGLFYDKDTMSREGITAEQFGTCGGFKEVCGRLKKGKTRLDCMRQIGVLIFQDISPWIWNFGGDFFTEDGSDTVLDSAPSLEGLDYYLGLVDAYMDRSDDVPDHSRINRFFFNNADVFFTYGLLAATMYMNRDSSGYNGEISKKIGIAIQPAGPAAAYCFTGGSCLSIMKYSPNKDMAMEFLHFLLEKEAQYNFTLWTGYAPCHKSAFRDVMKNQEEGKNVLTNSIEKAHTFPNHFLWPSIENLLSEFCAEILDYVVKNSYKTSFLKDAINRICRQIRYIMNQ
ncbi:MAG: extracellular solute-binding protein [Spirochaetales bacterium]|nr:extracellular solute-binding protein [Spirochaetales bacterium]